MMRPKPGEGNSDKRVGEGKNLFLGKVNIGDARAPRTSPLYGKMYTAIDGTSRITMTSISISRKKLSRDVNTIFIMQPGPLEARRKTNYNSYVQPLDKGTTFQVRLDFVGLTADEFGALLLAITLEEEMRHKIGYAKPLGLGSVYLNPQSMTLIDYASRYTQPGGRGQTEYTHDAIMRLRNELFDASQKDAPRPTLLARPAPYLALARRS